MMGVKDGPLKIVKALRQKGDLSAGLRFNIGIWRQRR